MLHVLFLPNQETKPARFSIDGQVERSHLIQTAPAMNLAHKN